ncbi:MAG: type II toxin-antitoxin system VapC family toxin [Chloroflexi bacterium]|nr:type II toxin-antitoxin system VapC family toxin [Chloroflexota bacterium]
MNTPDTSVVVAAFARWHERHTDARSALENVTALIGHVAVESFSVLTRMPPPQRVPANLVLRFLRHHFPDPKLALSSDGYDTLLSVATEHAIAGGAIYDALVAMTAKESGATLLTFDERAASVYQVTGVEYRLIQ